MALRKLTPAVFVLLIPAHVFLTSLAWRDLKDRPDEQVRGSKKLWRWATASNVTWSLAYLVIGRKRNAVPLAA
jgi:hypothetical protein